MARPSASARPPHADDIAADPAGYHHWTAGTLRP